MPGFETSLTLEQKQTMKLNPAQLQTLEILQMSTVQLEERIQTELMENPVLEIDENAHAARDSLTVENANDHAERAEDAGGDEIPHYDRYDDLDYWETASHGADGFENYYRPDDTLIDHLMKQLHATVCPDNVRRACRFVIYSLDKNGFLNMTPEELEDASENTAEEFRKAIPLVQGMDPAGIAARDLEECLRLQLDPEDELSDDAGRVISMLGELSSGKIKNIANTLGITQDRLARIIEVIRTLDPKPGMRFADGSSVKYAVPDVIVDMHDGDAHIYMAGSQPILCVNRYYADLAKESKDTELNKYLKEKIERAESLIRNIELRSGTIIGVTGIIVKRQAGFLCGTDALRPLTMQETADELGVNVSTVSRAVNGKYLKCSAGTYALRDLFTGEVAGGTRDSILVRIKEIIGSEDPEHPLSDQKITDILAAEGIGISRRAVAKYRDIEGILPTSQRRKRF